MTTIETFSSAITRVRNILRTVAITGMDSLRHTCLYLMARYITEARAPGLGIPPAFAWEALLRTARTVEGGRQIALDSFNNKVSDCLVNHFDRLFGTTEFPFTLAHIDKHKEILEIMDPILLDELECKTDILGWVYEEHLRTGSSGKGGRDLGQFFTDRVICKYMVDLCRPGFKAPGVPESVCDPSQGTAGFLTMWVKYFAGHYPEKPVDWKIQQKEVYGYDIDAKVAGIAALNMFMESGGHRFENILKRDSLYDDIPISGVDVILANMPFGVKSLTHAECCSRVKALKLNGTKSEPLFLQLMMASLNPGGRCAVVVPDGMLTNSSKCHNGTRKYLLDHFELRRIIKMKGKFFMNTGIQPSILFFERTGKPTSAVEFWDVSANLDGSITETLAATIPRAKLDASCSFDMRRYLEGDKPVANPAGFPMVKLGDYIEDLKTGKNKSDLVEGDYPFYMSNGISQYANTYQFDGEYVLTARCGSLNGSQYYVNGKFSASDFTYVLKPKEPLTAKYLYYFMRFVDWTKWQTGTTMKGIRRDIITDFRMPLPPRSIQDEIVATLDRIYAPGTTDLADTLKLTSHAVDLVLATPSGATLEPIVEAQRLIRKSAQMVADVKAQMVADVKAQMVAIMKSVRSRGFEEQTLGDLFEVKGGKAISKSELVGTLYPYYGCNGINGYVDTHLYDGEYILCAQDGSIGSVYLLNGKFYPSNHTHVIKTRDSVRISNAFGAYLLKFSIDWKPLITSIIPKVTQGKLLEIKLPVPPLDFQQSVIARLTALESQLTALESLQKQTEDNARFILESYLGSHVEGRVESESVADSIEHVDE